MTFGAPGTDGARVHDLKDIEAILDVFLKHGHREVRIYWGFKLVVLRRLVESLARHGARVLRRYMRRVFRQDQLAGEGDRDGDKALSRARACLPRGS
jgi:hypothetical protein